MDSKQVIRFTQIIVLLMFHRSLCQPRIPNPIFKGPKSLIQTSKESKIPNPNFKWQKSQIQNCLSPPYRMSSLRNNALFLRDDTCYISLSTGRQILHGRISLTMQKRDQRDLVNFLSPQPFCSTLIIFTECYLSQLEGCISAFIMISSLILRIT